MTQFNQIKICCVPWIQRDRTTGFDLPLLQRKPLVQYNAYTLGKSLGIQTIFPMLPK